MPPVVPALYHMVAPEIRVCAVGTLGSARGLGNVASKIDIVNLHGVFTASRLSSRPPQGGMDSLCLTSL